MRRVLDDTSLALGLAILWAGSTAVFAQEIGTAAAVNPAAQARGQSGSRTIVIGQSIAHRERIQTTSAGSVQLLFVDKTSMTIGPNSDLAIDEYVFDPNTNTGRLSATLAKGVMRFVGGQVSHTGNAQITTPNGVVGIRGGVGIIGTHQVFIGFGQGTVTTGSSSVTLDPGDYTRIVNGAPPTPPGPPPPGLISGLLSNFQSQGSQGGGAPASTGAVNQARAAATGSQNGPVVASTSTNGEGERRQSLTQQAASSATQSVWETVRETRVITTTPTTTPTSTSTPTSTQTTTQVEASPSLTSPQALSQASSTGGGTSPPDNTPTRYGGPAFTFAMGDCCTTTGGNVPYLPGTFTTGSNSFISRGMGYSPQAATGASNNGQTGSPPPANFFQWGVDITGSGANQSSWLSVTTGTLSRSGDDLTFSGGFGATRRGGGNQGIGRASGFLSSTAESVTLDDQEIPLSATINQQDYVAATNQYRDVQARFSTGGTGQLTNYSFTQQLTRTVTPTGLGTYRPEHVLTGWTGGLMQTISGSSTSSPYATIGIAEILLDPAQARLQATFDVVNATPQSLNGLFVGTFRMGSTNSTQSGQSAYVDYDNFAAREMVVVNPSGTQRVQLSTINLQRVTNTNTFMVNMQRDVARTVLPNTTICECEYTRWGFWSTDSQRNSVFGTRSERGHMMTWVAGQLPNAGEVPQAGVATYTGHVVANVSNHGAQYIASGNLTNTVNFGTRSGTAQVTGFDGANYQGQLELSRSDPRYIGAGLSSNVGNRTMLMTGSFFRGSQGPVGEMGGNAIVVGRNYLGSGIFAGRAN